MLDGSPDLLCGPCVQVAFEDTSLARPTDIQYSCISPRREKHIVNSAIAQLKLCNFGTGLAHRFQSWETQISCWDTSSRPLLSILAQNSRRRIERDRHGPLVARPSPHDGPLVSWRHGPRERLNVQYEYALHLGHDQPVHRVSPVAHHNQLEPHSVAGRYRAHLCRVRGAARGHPAVRGHGVQEARHSAAPEPGAGYAAGSCHQGCAVRHAELLRLYDHAHLHDLQWLGHDRGVSRRWFGIPHLRREHARHQGDCLPLSRVKQIPSRGPRRLFIDSYDICPISTLQYTQPIYTQPESRNRHTRYLHLTWLALLPLTLLDRLLDLP